MNPFLMTDGYKVSHHLMYPKGTNLVYSNFTPRSGKHATPNLGGVVCFGTTMTMQFIHEQFKNFFFNQPKTEVCGEIKKELSVYLMSDYDVSHIEALHELGYLPIQVRAIPEGEFVKYRTPLMTIHNTLPEFYWVTNFLETLISNLLWKPITSATTALAYRRILEGYAKDTDPNNMWFVDFQGHDFSMRGMDSLYATQSSGLGHALFFKGSDSLPVIDAARKFYEAKSDVVYSVNATEHSVMCAGSKDDEVGTFRRLMKTFPKGILSVVSDTWDLWKVCTEYLPELKEEILARDGKLVIRPDSGDPVDILCGSIYQNVINERTPEQKGVIELLWDVFGGTVNEQGYKVLDPHIGAIYGDSITTERASQICERLKAKGFASTNVVLGIGSYTYQYNTRDTHGLACKATYVEVNEKPRPIFKDPITDDGTKKSAKGLIRVIKDTNGWGYKDESSWEDVYEDDMITLYSEGDLFLDNNLDGLREKVKSII